MWGSGLFVFDIFISMSTAFNSVHAGGSSGYFYWDRTKRGCHKMKGTLIKYFGLKSTTVDNYEHGH